MQLLFGDSYFAFSGSTAIEVIKGSSENAPGSIDSTGVGIMIDFNWVKEKALSSKLIKVFGNLTVSKDPQPAKRKAPIVFAVEIWASAPSGESIIQ